MGADDTGDGLGDGDLAREWAGTDRKRSHIKSGEEPNLSPQLGVTYEHRFAAFEQNAAKTSMRPCTSGCVRPPRSVAKSVRQPRQWRA